MTTTSGVADVRKLPVLVDDDGFVLYERCVHVCVSPSSRTQQTLTPIHSTPNHTTSTAMQCSSTCSTLAKWRRTGTRATPRHELRWTKSLIGTIRMCHVVAIGAVHPQQKLTAHTTKHHCFSNLRPGSAGLVFCQVLAPMMGKEVPEFRQKEVVRQLASSLKV